MQSWMIWPILVLFVIVIPGYLDHRQKMAKLMKTQSTSDEQLLKRIKALEAKCDKLQEQVNEAHFLIHDETRQLDQKLLQQLGGAPAAEPESSQERRAPARNDVRV